MARVVCVTLHAVSARLTSFERRHWVVGHVCTCFRTEGCVAICVSERWLARQSRIYDGCNRIWGDAYGVSGYVGTLTH